MTLHYSYFAEAARERDGFFIKNLQALSLRLPALTLLSVLVFV